ncbi:uncharacterized protein BBA_07705 [Beauveria bassiana ARSEF 2860]|uniref:Protein kinase domain-containing protein n=1 Tax=Beauveria bassiana (strain ARSEF 2860) TaxID=655819 RepID=J5JJ05_BEAB2|nr:uncharacterized protein BBA_07705 [Beauveria bassiana ARSEF 2860]EJP63311.1 hypothetical protein BBA_07705 [Beauveria bassiana ARSEF 2860]
MDFRLEQLNSGPDGAHILASWIGMLFSLSIDVDSIPAHSAHDTPSQRMCRLVQCLRAPDITDDEYDAVSQDLFQRIIRAGDQLLREIVIHYRTRPVSPRLDDHLFLPIPLLCMVDSDDYDSDDSDDSDSIHSDGRGGSAGRLGFASRLSKYFPQEVKHAHPGADILPFDIDPDLPDYHVDQVHVLETLVHDPLVDHVACRVLVDGEQLFCKAERGGVAFGDSVVGRDFRTMLELRAALGNHLRQQQQQQQPDQHGEEAETAETAETAAEKQQQRLRVPSLRGVLRHPTEGHVIGFLRDWVPGASLNSYEMAELPAELRGEWDAKVARTLAELHRLGVYWGAAENESVIIDPHGEPWLVDFGAKVNLGLKREEGDREEGDWLDYDSIYHYLEVRDEAAVSDGGSDKGDFEIDVVLGEKLRLWNLHTWK